VTHLLIVVYFRGREKQASYDPTNRMPLLVEQFASKASMKQRRGRAGRVREGTCFKLISRNTFDILNDHSEPEIQRVALDQTLLQLIFIGVEPRLGTFTKTLLDPPNRESLEAAIFCLQKIGAVERGPNDDLVITSLGAHLAGIPAPPLVGKRKYRPCWSRSLY
jgi:ATP-dependent RNA helicase DHX57